MQGIYKFLVQPGFVDTPMTKVNKFHMPFLWTPQKAARRILDGVDRGTPVISFPLPMWLLMHLARWIPPRLYAFILSGKKERRPSV